MKSTTLLFLLCQSLLAHSQAYNSLISSAEKHYHDSAYAKSAALYQRAAKLRRATRSDSYNAACSAALAGDTTLAMGFLKSAVAAGYTDIRHIQTDADLNGLHKLSGWVTLTNAIQKKFDLLEAAYDKPLQTELLAIYDDDQNYRLKYEQVSRKFGFDSKQSQMLWDTINRLDSINLSKVKSILTRSGWVGPDQVGGQASMTLFLIVQHADLATQKTYLPMMRSAVKRKTAEPSALALLEDRVALGEGRKQLYGSQIGTDNAGKSFVRPLIDPDHVDQRRARMGLEPMAEYVAQQNIKWNVADYKRRIRTYVKLEKGLE